MWSRCARGAWRRATPALEAARRWRANAPRQTSRRLTVGACRSSRSAGRIGLTAFSTTTISCHEIREAVDVEELPMRRILGRIVARAVRAAYRQQRAGQGDPVQFLHQRERVADVLEHVQHLQRRCAVVGERQRLRAAGIEVGDDVHARHRRDVDVDPACERMAAAAEIEVQAHRRPFAIRPGCDGNRRRCRAAMHAPSWPTRSSCRNARHSRRPDPRCVTMPTR